MVKLNRRSVLGAIGLVGVGTGAAFGSGAFTSTTAQRAVEVNVFGAGDGNAGVVPGAGSDNAVADEEQRSIGTTITENAVDVLVDISSSDVAVRDDAEELYRSGNELFPAVDSGNQVYSNINGQNYVSLVANDVTIVFGPEADGEDPGDSGGVPPNSVLSYNDFFGFAAPNSNSPTVTFSTSEPDNASLLTDIDGFGDPSDDESDASSEVSDGDTANVDVTTGTDVEDTEQLEIEIGS